MAQLLIALGIVSVLHLPALAGADAPPLPTEVQATQAPAPHGEKQAVMDALTAFIGGTWSTDGKWTSGRVFRQDHVYATALRGQMITVKVYDSDSRDETRGAIGLRNEGVRVWDEAERVMKFWEFDRFGGITTGIVGVSGNDLYYEYDYKAGSQVMKLRNVWTKVDANTYTFKVGMVDEQGTLTRVLLDTSFKRTAAK